MKPNIEYRNCFKSDTKINMEFEKLYKEFISECEGTAAMMSNDTNRYKKWFKERVEQLCINYNSDTPDTEEGVIEIIKTESVWCYPLQTEEG